MRRASEGHRPARLALPALVVAIGGAAACAAASVHPFHTRFESGDYSAAERLFASDSALQEEPRALWRAAVIHAMPGSAEYDPDTTRARLERLLVLAPTSEYAPPAVALLGLMEETGRMEDAIAALRERLDMREAEGAAWHAALERAHPGTEAYDPQAAREALNALLEKYPGSRYGPAAEAVLALLDEVARNRAAVAALQRQLDQLKAVDLEDPPR